MSLSISSEGQYLSRWYGVDARSLAPNIFPDPEELLRYATMTLYEPRRELLERYLRGGKDAIEALKEFYYEARAVGKTFTVSSILREMVAEKERAARDGRPVDQTLMWVLWRHLRRRAAERALKELQEPPSRDNPRAVEKILDSVAPVKARLSELVVHPFNTRFVHHNRLVAKNFESVCGDGGLKEPLLVVPVAPRQEESMRLAELHVEMFEMIQEKIRAAALSDEELRRLIDEKGVGWVMRAFTGYREVMVENGRLVFTENDPLRQITGVKEPKYFIIDGQLRALTMMIRFQEGVEGKRYSRDRDDIVGVHVIGDADPLTVTYLSATLNTGLREASDEEQKQFLRAVGPVNKATISVLAARVGSDVMRVLGEMDVEESLSPSISTLSKDVWSVSGLVPKLSQPSDEESRRPSDRGGDATRLMVEQERSSRPTSTYFGGWQGSGAPSGTATGAWVSPEERPSQPQPLQLDEASILSALFDRYLAASSSGELRNYVFRDRRAVLRIEGDLQSNLVARGFRSTELSRAVEIWYTNMEGRLVTLGGQRFRVTFYGPVLPDKYCPKCRRLVVLSPIRCFFCGEVLDDEHGLLPHRLSHRPD
jgi:hypothetical protein